MKSLKYISACILLVIAVLMIGCDNEPLLTNLKTNRLIIIFKGTYESNNPQDWTIPSVCQTFDATHTSRCVDQTAAHKAWVQDDSVQLLNAPSDENPSLFMVDLAELRLLDFKKNQHKFGDYRQTYTFGLTNDDPFFNGGGFPLENDDVPSKTYAAIGLYTRKMLFDGTWRYSARSGGWSAMSSWDVFTEQVVPAFNFNTLQLHSFNDTLKYESAYFNRVYPIIIPINSSGALPNGMTFNEKFPVTVLEIRMVVKNFVKKYERESSDNFGTKGMMHYYAFSDWLQDVEKYDTTIGGNILTVARSYVPGLVGAIRVHNGTGHDAHIIAIPAGADINEYTIPGSPGLGNDTATPPSSPRTDNPCNLPKAPSTYLGLDPSLALDYFLKLERQKYLWNQKVYNGSISDPCNSFSTYQQNWKTFEYLVGRYKLPPLAVFAANGDTIAIKNAQPGDYDIYISSIAPRYGLLYYEGEFIKYANCPITVSIGSSHDSIGGTTMNF